MHRNGPAAGLPLTGAIRHVDRLADLPGRIGHHGPGQGGDFFGAQAGLHRQQEEDPIPVWIAGRVHKPQNRPLLGRTDNLGLLPLHGGPLAAGPLTHMLKILSEDNAMSLCHRQGKSSRYPASAYTAPQRLLSV